MTENFLLTNKHILVYTLDTKYSTELQNEFNYIKQNFCGRVYDINQLKTYLNEQTLSVDVILYACGSNYDQIKQLNINNTIYVIL